MVGARIAIFVAAIALLPAFAAAGEIAQTHEHSSASAATDSGTGFGRKGERREVTRTVRLTMGDDFRFSPAVVKVTRGETIRFQIRNAGKLPHEFVLGTAESLGKHAQTMRSHPGMTHNESHLAHVAPGRTGTVIWQFTRTGEFLYGCLVAGHFEAGMTGRLVVAPQSAKARD